MNRNFIIAALLLCYTTGYAQLSTRPTGFCYNTSTLMFNDSATFKYAAGSPGYNKPNGYTTYDMQCDTVYRYSQMTGIWLVNKRHVYKFNSARLPEEVTISITGPGATWVNSEKINCTYNSNNAMTERLQLSYDQSTGLWRNKLKETSIYNGNNLIQWKIEAVKGGVWVPNLKYDYYYFNNRLDSVVISVNDVTTNLWREDNKTFYKYGMSAGYDSAIGVWYSPARAGFVNTSLTVKNYNTNGAATRAIDYLWDSTAKDWLLHRDTRNTYNLKNQLIADTLSYWNKPIGTFEPRTIHYYTYDAVTGKPDTTITISNAGLTQLTNNNMVTYNYNSDTFMAETRVYDWDASGNYWELRDIQIYYFEQQPLSIASGKGKQAQLFIYPNPASDVLQVRLANSGSKCTMAIYNAMGVRVNQWEVTDNNTSVSSIPVAHLDAGNYILTVNDGSEEASQQFVIRR